MIMGSKRCFTHWTRIRVSLSVWQEAGGACGSLKGCGSLAGIWGIRILSPQQHSVYSFQPWSQTLCPDPTPLWNASNDHKHRSSVVPHSLSSEITRSPSLLPSLHLASPLPLPHSFPSFCPGCSSNVVLLVPLPGA